MFDKGQMAGLMKKAQEMQENMQKAQEEIAHLEVSGESGAGMVTVIMNGKHYVKKVIIDHTLMDDQEMLEDLIAAAVNDATRKIDEQSSEKMGKVTAGMPFNGLKLPF
ncbi:MAG: YbaB/EbfC family nucleoid-associated protein [Burkholderiales bacterium]|nr:YbaB/EbfC family nucleoid-associated protein [Burkholderiales bacterium]